MPIVRYISYLCGVKQNSMAYRLSDYPDLFTKRSVANRSFRTCRAAMAGRKFAWPWATTQYCTRHLSNTEGVCIYLNINTL